MTSFQEVLEKWDWKPMSRCPGRFILAGGISSVSFSELTGCDLPVKEYRVRLAPDPVFVCLLSEGGIISYRKEDEGYIHTLCDAASLERKLNQLEIE